MINIHIQRLKGFLHRHQGSTISLMLIGSIVSILAITTPDMAPRAHFLQQHAVQENVSQIRHPTTAFQRRKKRLQQRKERSIVRRLTTVAQATFIPMGVEGPMHSAAPSALEESFPAFGHAVHPVNSIPHWGAMTSPKEWNRTYADMDESDFVPFPPYDADAYTQPLALLLRTRMSPDTIRILTIKLYYSTRFFSSYDIDAAEFTGMHPGIDLKLAEGTPIGAVAGGRVHAIRTDEHGLGVHILIEHRAPDHETYYSIYGHLDRATVIKGQTVLPGQSIGIVGMTGDTSGPHVHLQIDRGEPGENYHIVYWPETLPSRSEAQKKTVNPMGFIKQYGGT